MEKRNYIELLDSFMKGKTSVEEEQILLEWFKSPEAKDEIFLTYLKQWENISDDLDEDIQIRMFEEIQTRINESEFLSSSAKPNKKNKWLLIRRYAAIACSLIIIGLGSYYITRMSLYSMKEFIVSVDKGQKANLILPDGTSVWLNSDSRIKYDNAYNTNDRRIILEGEAYFEVAKDKEKRFIVTANNIDVEALGTSFNIKSYQTDKTVTVTLVEGKLKVSDNKKDMLLNPNERLTYNKENKAFTMTDTYDVANVAIWRNNELAFYGESLEEIGTILSRIYNIDIVFTSESAKHYRFSGVIKNNSLGNVFEIISLTAPIQYKIYNNTVEISESKKVEKP